MNSLEKWMPRGSSLSSNQGRGTVRSELRSFLLAALSGLLVINCAHQTDDDYHIKNKAAHPHEQVMVSPPPVPPKVAAGKAPAKTVAENAPKTAAVPSLSQPKPASGASKPKEKSSGKDKAPKLTDLHLNLGEPLAPPVRKLIQNAEENLKKGKILEARSQADRAYRMDLRDPRTSFLMAKVAAGEKDYDGAEQWAMRALETISEPENKQVVWGLIARVREKSGNKAGVAEALRKRNEFKR